MSFFKVKNPEYSNDDFIENMKVLYVVPQRDDAFGEGNWEFDDEVTEQNANYVIENVNDLAEIPENVTFEDVSSTATQVGDNILISKTVKLRDGRGNHVDVDITFNFNTETKVVTNINSDIGGFVLALDGLI